MIARLENSPRPWRAAIFVLGALALLAGGALAAGVGPARGQPAGHLQVRPDLPVTTTDLRVGKASNSPQVATDPTDARFVVLANRLDGPDFGCALQVSGDGGRMWLPANPVPTLPEGAEKCYAPEVAFDRDGLLYYLFVGLEGGGNSPMGVFLTTSSDRARTFSAPRQVLDSERYQVRMALDPGVGEQGRIHLVWLEARSDPPLGGLPPPPNPIMAAYSDDGGHTFSTPVQVSDPERPRSVAPALAIGPDEAVHVLYYDLRDDFRDYQGLEGPTWDGPWSLVVASSTDRGRRFGPSVVVDDDLIPPERVMLIFTMPPPALVADDAGQVYAAWHDARNGDWDVFLKRSTDGGESWEKLQRLNDDPIRNGSHQYMPRLAVAPGGRLDAIFYDRRGNPENRGNDVYYTSSQDAGVTFSTNGRLNSDGSDSQIGPQYGVPSAQRLFEFGGRLGLDARESSVVAAWTDTRNTASGPPAQDIFATVVDLPSGNGPAVWARPAGAALAVSGLLLMLFCVWRWTERSRAANTAAVSGDTASASE